LFLIGVTILGGKFLSLFALKSQTNSLLMQLKTMSDPNAPRQMYNEQPQEPQQAPTPQPVMDEEVVANQTNFDEIDSLADAFNESEMEQVVETIE
jgi:hypothetical protein